MKRILRTLTLLFILIPAKSLCQSQDVSFYQNMVIETIGSFLDNPYHHSNTVKVHQLLKSQKELGDELFRTAWNHNRNDCDYITNTTNLIRITDQLIGHISDDGPVRWSSKDMIIIDPILSAFGWSKTTLCSCEDVEVYQYTKDNFKMSIVHNTRPKSENGYYEHFNSVSFKLYDKSAYSKKIEYYYQGIVFGDHYQIVQYRDDSNTRSPYHNILKVTSNRSGKID